MKNALIDIMSFPKKTATAIPIGSPVILNQSNTDYVTTTTTANDKAVYGVTMGDSVIEGEVMVMRLGVGPVRVAVVAGVAVGDFLTSHTVAGTAVEATAGQESFAKVDVVPGANTALATCFINCCHRG